MDHASYDQRRYPIVEVRAGYGEWAATYEQTVHDEMDVRLLDRMKSVDWSVPRAMLDLACGTGRIGAWLRARAAAPIDGVDMTPEMLDVARGKGTYRALHLAEVTATGLPAGAYDLAVQSLADEHLPDVAPLYREVARVTTRDGRFVLVGFHPHFLMAGMPTHFNSSTGDPLTIRSHVHLLSDQVKAARAAGWTLLEMDEGLVDDAWVRKKPKWERYRGLPITFSMAWRKD